MRMRKSILGTQLLVLFCSTGTMAASVIVKSIATGIDDTTGQKIEFLSLDTDYSIGVGSTEGVGLVPHTVSSAHLFADSDSSDSRWIAIDISHPESPFDANDDIALTGTYSFITSVDLTGYDATSSQIEGVRFGADNQLIGVLINGISVFSESPTEPRAEDFKEFHSLGTVGAGLMLPGLNEIEFKVYNAKFNQEIAANSMGFRAEGLVTANPIPEPSTALLLALGLIGFAARGRRV